MLELKGIKKDYPAGDGTVHALKGIDVKFRKSEFVSVLGPSGCGKTTMLNIIGGLDKYTEGDLVINGRSTKDFKDRDWDAYRNHSIGFVFQSYNLIPHQTVLRNVELALTLAGVGKAERVRRAKDALESVGLESQMNKLPSEMSGGQMQRVAIARALVNDPDIILADEPTGALDTQTSLQVMDILKEVAKTRLVVMVTHNPELAEKYSTRIIRMRDGLITDDSMPLSDEETAALSAEDAERAATDGEKKKPSMKFHTAFALSLKNLFTKKGRTILTSFAGSIGIIGIALILAVSQGTTTYINIVQEETLTSYPLTIEAKHTDISSLVTEFMGNATSSSEHGQDAVYEKHALYDLATSLGNIETTENDLKSFKAHIEELLASGDEETKKAIMGVAYSYGLDLGVYTYNAEKDEVIRSDISEITSELYSVMFGSGFSSSMTQMASSTGGIFSSMFSGRTAGNRVWEELLSGTDGAAVNNVVKSQYDLIRGDWPTAFDQVVIVVDENNEIDDLTLYALGLKTKEEMQEIINRAKKDGKEKEEQDYEPETAKYSFEEIMSLKYKVILSSDCYVKNGNGYTDVRESAYALKNLYDNKAIELKVVGIIRPRKDATSTMLNGTICYTDRLTREVISRALDSDIVKEQLANPKIDVLTGLPFPPADDADAAGLAADFRTYVSSLPDDESGRDKKAEIYVAAMSIMPSDRIQAATYSAYQSGNAMESEDLIESIVSTMFDSSLLEDETIVRIIEAMDSASSISLDTMVGMKYIGKDAVKQILSAAEKKTLVGFYSLTQTLEAVVAYAVDKRNELSAEDPADLAAGLDDLLSSGDVTDERLAVYYRVTADFSKNTYEQNLVSLGYFDVETPDRIYLYASTFANKDKLVGIIDAYNKNADDFHKISYTDYVGLIMSSVTDILNAITYVLIAFVAISLIVSSIMIGVITLISVQERTKEIGILRAIGASKRNVSSMFNAETVIIGFSSGLLGVLVTYLLCIPINIILHALTGLGNLSAILPIGGAVILIAISVLLTLIAGIIPSRSAAKKDPVVALRTE
ncbi:MAG TPA: ABC transporter [Clostridiales bacterium]|nr:ABC transporter [Clostridiales bacterium]